MNIRIDKEIGHVIPDKMMGLFFEDINYSADGGLYAEMLENRSFEFLKASGGVCDYHVEYDGGYGWSAYPEKADIVLQTVMGSPLCEENPHYMRVTTNTKEVGLANKAYDGICLKKGMQYKISFWARCVSFQGDFIVTVIKDEKNYAVGSISAIEGTDETYNFFKKYEFIICAEDDVDGAIFTLTLSDAGIVEFDFISMFPMDAVAGIFRKDLFDLLKEMKPGFIRFPGGCIVEGNSLVNRYRFKDTLMEPWRRKNNWNRWAVHGNKAENHFESQYSHYNQTLGLGFYEYFLLCEMIGAQPLPVLNVGMACQFQSKEMVATDSVEFKEYVQDARDLIEFANGDVNTPWGAVRAEMGHPKPFGLTMLGIGNEQWQSEKADYYTRYEIFEREIHKIAPEMKLIGSAGPDITSEKYKMAWEFYHKQEESGFAYAVDEHYYVKPDWLFEHVDFYDEYSRKIKVFSGEYAAHPENGMNKPYANTLEAALAEAAFMTGIERNSDVVVLASYAPLFARIGYAQWSPDLIWFDGKIAYGSPSYYVQKMYGQNMGDVLLLTHKSEEKEFAKRGVYYSVSYLREKDEIIVKIVNQNEYFVNLGFDLDNIWGYKQNLKAQILTHNDIHANNSIDWPEKVKPYEIYLDISEGITLPPYAFAVIRM